MSHVMSSLKLKLNSFLPENRPGEWVLTLNHSDPRDCLNRAMGAGCVKDTGAQQVPMVNTASSRAQGADAFGTVSKCGGSQRSTG